MLEWLGLAMKDQGEHYQSFSTVEEEFAEEEGRARTDIEQQKQERTLQQKLQLGIENLRKQFETNTELQKTIWQLLK